MSIIALLIGVSLFIALLFLVAYVWANKTGQYEDIDGQAVHILFDKHKKTNTSDYE